MDDWGSMTGAAVNALDNVLGIKSNDRVLILSDIHSSAVSAAFYNASVYKGCETQIYKIEEDSRPLREIPAELTALLKGKSVVLNIIKAFAAEIPFRVNWLFAVGENKKRKCAHMPGITKEMMTNGAMNVDYEQMRTTARKLIGLLKNASSIHITTREGTDLTLGVNERAFTDDVHVEPGGMCNLPCGEIYCAPEENRADGIVVFNASVGDIGLLKHPLKAYLIKGRLINFESEDTELVKTISYLTDVDNFAKVIGELGIGINPGASITGNMLEDEKVLRTAHIALGNNADFPGGGGNTSRIHRDYLFHRPTMEVSTTGNSKFILMKDGDFCF